jgi:hypothetical protein
MDTRYISATSFIPIISMLLGYLPVVFNQRSVRFAAMQVCIHHMTSNLFLVDPVLLSALPRNDLAFLEPKSNLLLGVLDRVGAVADITAYIYSEIATYCTRLGCKRVGSTEESCGVHILDEL